MVQECFKVNENIILVTIDCLRNDYYNTNNNNLPFLNYLESHATYYSNCHALADNTLSSVPQLLTSTFLNFIPYKEAQSGEINEMCQIKEPRKPIAQTLKENGYNTYGFQTAVEIGFVPAAIRLNAHQSSILLSYL